MIQPIVKPVVKLVWQPVVSCIQTFNRLSNPFDNRLYRVNGVLPSWSDSAIVRLPLSISGKLTSDHIGHGA